MAFTIWNQELNCTNRAPGCQFTVQIVTWLRSNVTYCDLDLASWISTPIWDKYPMQKPFTRNARKTMNRITIKAVAAFIVLGLVTGCAATTRTLDPDVEQHYDASYDFSDKKQIVQTLTDSLLSSPGVITEPEKPVIIVYGVDNETSEHISTSGITDDIRLSLIKSGQYRFLNRKQRDNLLEETDYQYAGFVPPEQRVSEGRQLGADYILSGTLRSIEKKQSKQWRLNRRRLIYYSMNLELTNLQTGEISWADNVEIAREASRPIIGW